MTILPDDPDRVETLPLTGPASCAVWSAVAAVELRDLPGDRVELLFVGPGRTTQAALALSRDAAADLAGRLATFTGGGR